MKEHIFKNGKLISSDIKEIIAMSKAISKDQNVEDEIKNAINETSEEVANAALNLIAACRVLESSFDNPNATVAIEYFKNVLSNKLNHLKNLCYVFKIICNNLKNRWLIMIILKI